MHKSYSDSTTMTSRLSSFTGTLTYLECCKTHLGIFFFFCLTIAPKGRLDTNKSNLYMLHYRGFVQGQQEYRAMQAVASRKC